MITIRKYIFRMRKFFSLRGSYMDGYRVTTSAAWRIAKAEANEKYDS